MRRLIGDIGQWLGVILLSVGVGYEIVYHAEFGLIVITVGSFIFTVFTKIKHHTPSTRTWLKSLRRP